MGLTQEELAEKTDYSVDFISLVERGINAPTLARLKDISDVIGVEVWQLFYSDGNKTNPAQPQLKRPTTKRKRNKA